MELRIQKLQRASLAVGMVGLAACGLGALTSPPQFFRSYLVGYLYWIGIGLGGLALLMLQHVVGGKWGLIIRRLTESASRTLPLMALLFIPLLFGFDDLYVWSDPVRVAGDELLQHKRPYLNVPFFVGRSAAYFALWIGMAAVLNRWSRQQDETGSPALLRRFRLFSAFGLAAYGLTVTFASIDWVMSLEPHWFSTIYGGVFMLGQGLTTLAFAIPMLMLFSQEEPLRKVLSPSHYQDLGNLMLAFVMLWAYLALSQFLIIWSGNLPEETPWYIHRMGHGWQWIALALVAFHFGAPFLVLLSRSVKRTARLLLFVAFAILLLRWVDLFWLVAPTFQAEAVRIHWLDLAAPLGIGGIWLALFLRFVRQTPLLPRHDPRLALLLESKERIQQEVA